MTKHRMPISEVIHQWANGAAEFAYASNGLRYDPATHSLSMSGIAFARYVDIPHPEIPSARKRILLMLASLPHEVRKSRQCAESNLLAAIPGVYKYPLPQQHKHYYYGSGRDVDIYVFHVDDVMADLDPAARIEEIQARFAAQKQRQENHEVGLARRERAVTSIRVAIQHAFRQDGTIHESEDESNDEWIKRNHYHLDSLLDVPDAPSIDLYQNFWNMTQANFLAEWFGLPEPFPISVQLPLLHEFALGMNTDHDSEVRIRAERAERQAVWKIETDKRVAEREKLWPEREARWRAGERVPSINDYGSKPTMLRVDQATHLGESNWTIETSRGARVNYRQVKMLYDKVVQEPDILVALRKLSDKEIKIGNFEFTDVKVDAGGFKTLVIGCHYIPWIEVERLFTPQTVSVIETELKESGVLPWSEMSGPEWTPGSNDEC